MNRLVSSFTTSVLGVLVGAALVGGIVWARDDGGSSKTSVVAAPTDASQTSSNTSASSGAQPAAAGDLAALYDRVRPSVVEITTGQQATDPFSGGQAGGLGSGIVLDTEGHILTNYHVVRGSNSVTIKFADGTVASADVVGTDPGDDTALVKADVTDTSVLKPATLGDSSQMKVGMFVAAIGNPFGLEGSFTTGVISGLERTLQSSSDGRPIRGLLQSDAAVNPGNSGGALLNAKGEVIGINTAIENPGGNAFAGVAYAVPINTPKRYLTQLTAGQTITHARLGISGKNLTAADLKTLGIDHGVAIVAVDSGSGAGQAGLQSSANGKGDVITAIDGNAMTSFDNLADYIDTKNVGDQVKLAVHRDGKDIEITATLKSWDSSA